MKYSSSFPQPGGERGGSGGCLSVCRQCSRLHSHTRGSNPGQPDSLVVNRGKKGERYDTPETYFLGSSLIPHGTGPVGSGIATAAEEIRFGFTPPVTGASAAEGSFQIKALKLALKEINAAGGVNGKKIDLRTVDNQSSNPGALAALQKAVEQEKALVLVGFVKSTQILAASDAIKNYGIPTIVGGTNVNLTLQGNPWIFRVRPDDSIAALAMVKYIKEDAKLTKIGILHDTDAFGAGGADLVEKYAKENGVTVVKREKYTTKDKDYTAQLLSLKSAGAEVMVVYAPNPEDAAVIMRQHRQLGAPYKYLGSPSSQHRDALNLAKDAAEGLLAVADFVPGATEANRNYETAYRKEYNEDLRRPLGLDLRRPEDPGQRDQEGRRGSGQDPGSHPRDPGLQGRPGQLRLHVQRGRAERGQCRPDRKGKAQAAQDRQRGGEVVAPLQLLVEAFSPGTAAGAERTTEAFGMDLLNETADVNNGPGDGVRSTRWSPWVSS